MCAKFVKNVGTAVSHCLMRASTAAPGKAAVHTSAEYCPALGQGKHGHGHSLRSVQHNSQTPASLCVLLPPPFFDGAEHHCLLTGVASRSHSALQRKRCMARYPDNM